MKIWVLTYTEDNFPNETSFVGLFSNFLAAVKFVEKEREEACLDWDFAEDICHAHNGDGTYVVENIEVHE